MVNSFYDNYGKLSVPSTITANGITSTTGNIVATAGQVNAGTTMTAGTGITATTGNILASTGDITSTLGTLRAPKMNIDSSQGMSYPAFGTHSTYIASPACRVLTVLNPVYTFSQGIHPVTGSGTLTTAMINGVIQPTVGTAAIYTLTLPNATDVFNFFNTFELSTQGIQGDRCFFVYLVDPPAAIVTPDTWNFANSADGSFILSSPIAINPIRGTNFMHVCRIQNTNPLAAGAIVML